MLPQEGAGMGGGLFLVAYQVPSPAAPRVSSAPSAVQAQPPDSGSCVSSAVPPNSSSAAPARAAAAAGRGSASGHFLRAP